MSQLYLSHLTTQAPAMLTALRVSYGMAASQHTAARARALAQSAHIIRPGVFVVGQCQVNLWRMACTCKEHRARALAGKPFKPCAHFLALYLAGEWSPAYNPAEYLASLNEAEPEVIATYCRAKLPACYPPAPLGFEILEAAEGWATLRNLATNTHASAPVSALNRVVFLYA